MGPTLYIRRDEFGEVRCELIDLHREINFLTCPNFLKTDLGSVDAHFNAASGSFLKDHNSRSPSGEARAARDGFSLGMAFYEHGIGPRVVDERR